MYTTKTILEPKLTLTGGRPETTSSVARAPDPKTIEHALSVAKQHRGRDSFRSLAAISCNYAIIALSIGLGEVVPSLLNTSEAASYTIRFLALLIISSRLRAFENLVHEASHNNLFQTARTHSELEFLYAFPVFRLLDDYKSSHLIHHKFLGDPVKDPDIVRLQEIGLHKIRDSPTYYLFGLPATGYLVYEYAKTTFLEFWISSKSRISKTVYWTAILGLVTYTSAWRLFALYYLAPLFLILSTTRYWAEASEHLGMDLTSPFANSRNNLGLWHKWYQHPHNDGYHAVHHLYAQVPFHRLPEVHELLMKENKDYRDTAVISDGFMTTFKQMATAPTTVAGGQKWH